MSINSLLVCGIIQKFLTRKKKENALYHHRYINNKVSMASLSLTSIKRAGDKEIFLFSTFEEEQETMY